jgi:peptidoglycan/xylan/chitin deacetylase (PgdA/CDA1 family)
MLLRLALRQVSTLLIVLSAMLMLATCGRGATPQLVVPLPTIPETATPTANPTLAPTSTPLPPTSTSAPPSAATPVPTAQPTATATRPIATPTPSVPTATAVPPTAPPPTSTSLPVPTPTRTLPPSPTATKPPAPPPPTATKVPPTAVPSAAPVGKARTIDRGPASRKTIALTFDAGADRGYAERILNTLRDTNVKATFGMTGRWAEQNPDLVQRMVAEGHLLMNHTYDHASFTGYSPGTKPLTADERRREIERTETVIRALTGVELKPYFRPPYGDYDDAMLTQLGQLGYAYSVMWTVDSLGWNGYTTDKIIARCMAGAAPGAILLFHVGADSQDAAALPELIRQLKAAGYTFGTIAELLR